MKSTKLKTFGDSYGHALHCNCIQPISALLVERILKIVVDVVETMSASVCVAKSLLSQRTRAVLNSKYQT